MGPYDHTLYKTKVNHEYILEFQGKTRSINVTPINEVMLILSIMNSSEN